MMLDARDMILVSSECLPENKSIDDRLQTSVKDIEDIVAVGKKSCVCPYYATRKAVKQSQVSIQSIYSLDQLTQS